jgi:putative membrane protein
MNETAVLLKNFNWRMLLMRLLVNMLTLLITVLVIPEVYFVDRSLGAWMLMAVMLGVLNMLVKPIIQFLTLRFIFITGGLVLILINAVVLYLLSWLLPQLFEITSIFWAVVAGAALGLSSTFLENLFGLTTPIVSDKYPKIRQRVKDRQFYRMQAELSRIESQKTETARELPITQAVEVVTEPAALPVLAQIENPPVATAVTPPLADEFTTVSPNLGKEQEI